MKKNFQKKLILVFEVIVQPLKHTLGCSMITSKAKINVFKKISSLRVESPKFKKMLILSFEANSELSCLNRLFSAF